MPTSKQNSTEQDSGGQDRLLDEVVSFVVKTSN
jgi:hypothetical protein